MAPYPLNVPARDAVTWRKSALSNPMPDAAALSGVGSRAGRVAEADVQALRG